MQTPIPIFLYFFLPIVEGRRLQIIALTCVTLDIALSLEKKKTDQLKEISSSDTLTCKTSDISQFHSSSKFECSATPPPQENYGDPFCLGTKNAEMDCSNDQRSHLHFTA